MDWIAINGGVILKCVMMSSLLLLIVWNAKRDIDVSRAERAKNRAEELIREAKSHADVDELRRATVALHRAINRINVSKHQ